MVAVGLQRPGALVQQPGAPLWSRPTFLSIFVCRAFKPPSGPERSGVE